MLRLVLGTLAAVAAAAPAAAQSTAATVSAPADGAAGRRPTFHFAARLNSVIQGKQRDRIDDVRLDSILVVPGMAGQLTPYFSWVFNAVVYGESFDQANLRALDAIASFKLAAALQISVGRFVVPFDRFNLSGPFKNLIWNFPGVYDGRPRVGGENGPFGRDTGAGAWGSLGGGLFKYYFMAHQLETRKGAPRLTGRVALSLLDREPGYFVSSSYAGTRNVIALGAGLQYQQWGRRLAPAVATDPPLVLGDLWAVTTDLFVEHVLPGGGGTATADLAFYAYDRHRPLAQAYHASFAYLLPWQLGPGRTQLGARWQQAFAAQQASGQPDLAGLDVTANYLLDGYNLRLGADYSRQWLGAGIVSNAVLLGVQIAHH